jgi:hypothetical protein
MAFLPSASPRVPCGSLSALSGISGKKWVGGFGWIRGYSRKVVGKPRIRRDKPGAMGRNGENVGEMGVNGVIAMRVAFPTRPEAHRAVRAGFWNGRVSDYVLSKPVASLLLASIFQITKAKT